MATILYIYVCSMQWTMIDNKCNFSPHPFVVCQRLTSRGSQGERSELQPFAPRRSKNGKNRYAVRDVSKPVIPNFRVLGQQVNSEVRSNTGNRTSKVTGV